MLLALSLVPTFVDEWFVGNRGWGVGSGAEVMPFPCHFVMAEKDKASFLAREGVLHAEA